jgi:tetratricopeptide (TPR) repeat protein
MNIAMLVGMLICSSSAQDLPGQTSLIDPNNQDSTVLIPKADAENAQNIENASAALAELQDGMKAGSITAEQGQAQAEQLTSVVTELAEKMPESTAVQTCAARFHIQAGDPDKAISYAQKALDISPNDPFPLVTMGVASHMKGDYPRADEMAHLAMEANRAYKPAASLHFLSHGRAPRSQEGLSGVAETADTNTYKKILEEAQPPLLADILKKDAKIKQATENYLKRKKARGLLAGTIGKMQMRDHDGAIRQASMAIEADPRFADAYMERGMAKLEKKDSAGAEQDLSNAIYNWSLHVSSYSQIARNLAPAYALRARANMHLGRKQQALADVDRALKWNPRSGTSLMMRGEIKKELGYAAEEILKDFKLAMDIDPANFSQRYEQELAAFQEQNRRQAAKKLREERGATRLGRAHNKLEDYWGSALPPQAVPTAMGGLGALFGLMIFGMIYTRRD